MKLAQEVAIITGAARGIGRAIAEALAKEGAKVVLVDLLPAVHDTAAELRQAGHEVLALTGDVSSFDEAQQMVDQTIAHFGQVDILVNNAGITRDNLLLRMPPEDWEKVININLTGTFNLTKAAIKHMIKRKTGKIINIASIIGEIGNVGQANYAASKAGVIAFTKSVAKELGSRGIRANAVAPGFIKSQMTDVLPDKVKAELEKQIPLSRLGLPEDVAKAVVFLASSDADYITGQVLNIDGGMVM
ncbi:MAG TPA: 3-oxoacyl-[acyl-carrier-protein] reductase [Firmicutes bacterium]|uniref:3-oxoacyl-[acyl-carrier-protein] reductase n=1 Tax=Capillibacterium thermochitinicola TaxID=2699427 RepID=A0A8J6I1T1_9FIRM|nr:3-oxoacyl-[acyl-carrier-protein] reductase [Capillibacterium thermochitinicola]MBA2132824.1 3-oxoacyl-[acyl-carrier-protein] reductase [Capillibacterium thermochitinicola]HHW11682.1 3-oxoacyl-[acyl-carrier-protein] reductase [Bacillota bacterium]